jgi:hypothetical protein
LPAASRAKTRLPATDWLLELDLFLADAMSFVPVQFSFANRTIRKANGCYSLHFSPPTGSVLPVEPATIANACPRGNRLDSPEFRENFEPHVPSLAQSFRENTTFARTQPTMEKTDEQFARGWWLHAQSSKTETSHSHNFPRRDLIVDAVQVMGGAGAGDISVYDM